MSDHIVLLGDSIFDHASYTKGQPDVITHLRGILPSGAAASGGRKIARAIAASLGLVEGSGSSSHVVIG